MIDIPEIKLIVESLPPAYDGTQRFEVGYEADGYTNAGYACDSPEMGLLRMMGDVASQTDHLARTMAVNVAVIHALAEEIAKVHGVAMKTIDWASKHVTKGEFASTRIVRAENRAEMYRERLTQGHRCEHGRLCIDNCYVCPDGKVGSAGGWACAADDPKFWHDFSQGQRRKPPEGK